MGGARRRDGEWDSDRGEGATRGRTRGVRLHAQQPMPLFAALTGKGGGRTCRVACARAGPPATAAPSTSSRASGTCHPRARSTGWCATRTAGRRWCCRCVRACVRIPQRVAHATCACVCARVAAAGMRRGRVGKGQGSWGRGWGILCLRRWFAGVGRCPRRDPPPPRQPDCRTGHVQPSPSRTPRGRAALSSMRRVGVCVHSQGAGAAGACLGRAAGCWCMYTSKKSGRAGGTSCPPLCTTPRGTNIPTPSPPPLWALPLRAPAPAGAGGWGGGWVGGCCRVPWTP